VSSPPENRKPIRAPPTERRAKILVIEDEAALGRVLVRLLRPHQVTTVTRARAGLKQIAGGAAFDVILCDLMMPEMTGMDFFAELGRTHPDLAPRVVFMSGGAFTPDARAFLEKHASRRLDKPIDVARLRRLVDDSIAK
jgi:CheY-like chemotaxis protein